MILQKKRISSSNLFVADSIEFSTCLRTSFLSNPTSISGKNSMMICPFLIILIPFCQNNPEFNATGFSFRLAAL